MKVDDGLPLRLGDQGVAVTDLHQRLADAGFPLDSPDTEKFCAATDSAVRKFQESRGLEIDGTCGTQTWAALAEAAHRLGDRLIYLQSPMLRGDDVSDLQARLGSLGFDAGRVDGIFGPDTRDALDAFQRNVGLQADGICGPDSVAALRRLGGRERSETITEIREREALRQNKRQLHECQIVVGEYGGLDGVVATVTRSLQQAGAVVHGLHHPHGSHHARQCNEIDAALYVGITVRDQPGASISYFETDGYVSYGGRHLANLLAKPLAEATGDTATAGKRLPVLRETRMPAVLLRVGPPSDVSHKAPALAAAITEAIAAWVTNPIPEDPPS